MPGFPIEIAPSILSADFARLGEDIRAVVAAGADLIHVDVMDGHFVPNLTIGLPVIEALRRVTHCPLDVHLMITNAEQYLEQYVAAGANLLALHAEACTHLHRALAQIKSLGCQAGVVLNPATPVEIVRPVVGDLDFVLIMTVNPGFGGQSFIPSSLAKIQRLVRVFDETGHRPRIEVDGGVTMDNIAEIAAAGADRFVAGSGIFKTADYGVTIAEMRALATAARG